MGRYELPRSNIHEELVTPVDSEPLKVGNNNTVYVEVRKTTIKLLEDRTCEDIPEPIGEGRDRRDGLGRIQNRRI